MCSVSIIAAVAKNKAIGKNNGLLCHIPGDLKRFKSLTTNHAVIMGRHTFESLPKGPLPNRKNIIITTMPEHIVGDCFPADSLEDAFDLAGKEKEVFVIGGGAIYKQAIDKANKMYLTLINGEFEGDTFFPEVNFDEWKEIFREEHKASGDCPHDFSFVNYERK